MSRPAPAEDCDSPTVEPLRIFRPLSPSFDADASSRYRYPAPPTSSFSAASSSKLPPLPSFPMPPGASSSAAPLPYPEDEDHRQTQAPTAGRPPYPAEQGRKSSASSGSYNDVSPRLSLSPVDRLGGNLAARRGTAPKPLSPTSPDDDDKDELFAKPLGNPPPQAQASTQKISNAYQQKPYYPPPGGASNNSNRTSESQNNVNRFSSTASNSTTRASRGSPPPPETPVYEPGSLPALPGGNIEARYAAAGISGTGTLNSLQAQSAAAQSRLAQYGNQLPAQQLPQPQQQQQQQQQPPRPWTPTEHPDQQPHGPPTVYQGSEPLGPPQQPGGQLANPNGGNSRPEGSNLQVSVLEQDFQRMQASTPPPAYTPGSNSQPYPQEKQRPAPQQRMSSTSPPQNASQNGTPAPSQAPSQVPPQASQSSAGPSIASPVPITIYTAAANPATAGLASPGLDHASHPAFANEPKQSAQDGHPALAHTPSLMASVSSPPPLPEGWIAHLDQNSGQYYYIHLATQATQWEFPKGPHPINHDVAPLSPTASTYGNPLGSPFLGGGKQSLNSPLFAPATPGYAESIMSVAASATPSTAGFSGPPPSAGVDMYKITPTNGVYFGPYLRYVNMDVERGIWLGSILIVTDAPQAPTIHIHQSMDLSPNPRQLVPHNIFTHQRWTFYKYDIDLQMSEGGTERWTYAVTSHLGCTRYEFVVAGRHETGWRMVAHSGNDFSPSTSQNDRAKLGGVGFMWKDVLQKNVECGGFHVQLGLGDQIYGDRLWREVPLLRQWLAMQGRENRKNAQWTARHEEDASHAYFHYYTSHFDQPFLREAFAQIPHVLQLDDHDM